MKKRCSVHGCHRPQMAKGFCSSHYNRQRDGRPLEAPIRKCIRGLNAKKKLRAYTKVDKETGCHLWTGCRDAAGYGRIYVGARRAAAHRVAWEEAHGPIPEGMIVMHAVCDNPRCCNPEHLKLGTHAENAHDRINKGRGKGARKRDLELHPQWRWET